MDFTFLADRIKTQLLEFQPDSKPLCVIRGSGGFNNEPGESYIISYSDAIYLYNRKFSDPDFAVKTVNIPDLKHLLLKQEAFSALLSIELGDELIELKISSAEIPNAELMLEMFGSCNNEVEEQFTGTEESDDGQISPFLGLVILMMFVATVDNDIADEENDFIAKFCADDKLYNKAYEYYRNGTFEEILTALRLNEQQKMCYLANILELAMVDGAFDSKEQKMIRTFAEAAELTEAQARTIRDVLLIKNQLSVLQ
jgi:uncharacterized tellurite resistance protein B-like protein